MLHTTQQHRFRTLALPAFRMQLMWELGREFDECFRRYTASNSTRYRELTPLGDRHGLFRGLFCLSAKRAPACSAVGRSEDERLTIPGTDLTGLFEMHASPRRRSFPAFAISVALHSGGSMLVSWALLHTPAIAEQPVSRYKVRQLDFHTPDIFPVRSSQNLYPTPLVPTQAHPVVRQDAAAAHPDFAALTHKETPPPALAALHLPDGGQGKQILIQPQVDTHIALQQPVPLPTVLLWKPEVTAALKITPPPPEKMPSAELQTAIRIPNEELRLAPMPARAAAVSHPAPSPPAGSSSPVAVKTPADVNAAPATLASHQAQPAPAAVLSVSDIKMNEGTALLPPVNVSSGDDRKAGAAAASGTILTAHNAAGIAGSGENSKSRTVISAAGSSEGTTFAGESAEHIQLPRDGKFSVVVVGATLADQYPEILQVWNDRTAYTAYLHVGTPKAWILQYAQLSSADAAAGGAVTRLEAPWPYDILRPNLLTKDLNADALMVRGILNESGRLEKMAIAYPPAYKHGSFVLHELALWQFRPAQQSGKAAPVEVLLIIPEQEAD